tara:strand:+ start:2708 stop:3646 length:939 start_codon:yes stop_codon:yes gene_type:complete
MPNIVKSNLSKQLTHFLKSKLLKDELVVLPTETVYGLAGLGTNIKAAKKIFLLKKRPLKKKLIFHCSSLKMVDKFFKLDDENLILAKEFWPGPLTLVLQRKSLEIPKSLTLNNECAVRVPNNKFTLNLINKVGKPLVMPSANKFKQLSPINSEMVFQQFIETNLLIVDDGKCKVGIESTLIKISDNKLNIIRPGFISLENVKKILPYMVISKYNKNLSFPGTSKKHYSPKKKIYLNVKNAKKKSAYINFGANKRYQFKNLSKNRNLIEAAKNLYHFIFLADNDNQYKNISIAPIPYKKIGIAINDRLRRASK